jgi:hypothetical protein
MQLDLTDEETRALLNLLMEANEADRYPLSPRIRLLRGILAKFGPMAPAPPPGHDDEAGCGDERREPRKGEVTDRLTLRAGTMQMEKS